MRGGRLGRLHRDDLDTRPRRLGHDGRARRAAAASDGHDHGVDVGAFLQDLERVRADARDQVRFVAGVDIAIAVLRREPLAVLAGLVIVAALQEHLGAEIAHGLDLHRIRAFGRDDSGTHPKDLRRKCDRLAMVASRGGDHAARPRRGVQLRDQVHAAANLEGAGRQQVVVLDPDLGSGQPVEGRVIAQRRRREIGANSIPRRHDVSESRRLERHLGLAVYFGLQRAAGEPTIGGDLRGCRWLPG